MPPIHVVIVAVLLLTAPLAYGQDTQQSEGPEATAAPPARVAVPRGQARTPDAAPPPASAPAPQRVPQRRPTPIAAPPPAPAAAPAPVAAASPAEDGQRRAVPRGSRPRGDNPAVGVAVPRETRRPPSSGGGVYRNGGVYRSSPRGYANYNYNNFYVYPQRYYPYGYGGFGLGFFYYDPYRWFPGYYGGGYGAGGPYGYGGYYGGYYGSGYGGYGYDIGQLRLRVTPRHAEVYVDGYYAGTVDDYDGIAQSLTLESGPYRIELVAPGYEPLEFNVRITPGQKVTYRGDLRPRP